MEKKLVLDNIVGFNPFDLPDNKCNVSHRKYFKMRALFKVMLFVHQTMSFPRLLDPDLGQYKKDDKGVENLPLTYDPMEILDYRIGNCSTYSTLFEALAENIGFKSRHIGLLQPGKFHGHWCSEVLVEKKWCFFDPMYLVCPVNKDKEGYSAYEIVKNPDLYINEIPAFFEGIQRENWLKYWKGLEVEKICSYDIGMDNFIEKFYRGNYAQQP